MEKELSNKESIAIITSMISKAKRHAAGDGSFQLLLWGWVVAICNFGHFILIKIGYGMPYIVWLLILPAVVISIWYSIKNRQKALVKTAYDEILSSIWISIFVGMLITLSFMPVINFQQNPIILILAGIGVILTGVVVRVNQIFYGGVLLMAASVIAFFLPVTEQYLVAGVAMILGYLVPGYYLKNTYRERV